MKWLKRVIVSVGLLFMVYLLGPKPDRPVYDDVLPDVPGIRDIDRYVAVRESAHQVKPGNKATIIWANDSTRQVTDYAVVYLHGFSASQEEGNPVHRNIARQFGCNLYLSRLSEHGIDTSEQLLQLTPESYWQSACEALAIGGKLGKKVILMGTSTGGTQALQLAAAFPDKVAALVLYSPNIAINDPNAWLLNDPWGLQIARLVKRGKYHDPDDERPIYRRYWNKPYRLEAVVALQNMLETTMSEKLFQRVTQPVLMLYYYKDEQHQDKVVRVDAMKEMFDQLATPPALKRGKAMPLTGDHVLASPIKSRDVAGVERETVAFLREIVGLKPGIQ